jgi:hypothetical protein
VTFRSCLAETLFNRGDCIKAAGYFLAVANTTVCCCFSFLRTHC